MERARFWTALPSNPHLDEAAIVLMVAWAKAQAAIDRRQALSLWSAGMAAIGLALIAFGVLLLASTSFGVESVLSLAGAVVGIAAVVAAIRAQGRAAGLPDEVPDGLVLAYWTVNVVPYRPDAVFLWSTLHEDRGQLAIFSLDRQRIEHDAQALNCRCGSLEDEADFLEKLGQLRDTVAAVSIQPLPTSFVLPASALGQALAALWGQARPLNMGRASKLLILPKRNTGDRAQWILCCDGVRGFLQARHDEVLQAVKMHASQQADVMISQLSGLETVHRHGILMQKPRSIEPSPTLVAALQQTANDLFAPVAAALSEEIRPELVRLERDFETQAARTRSDFENRLQQARQDYEARKLDLHRTLQQYAADCDAATAQMESAQRELLQSQKDQFGATGPMTMLFGIPASERINAAQRARRAAQRGLSDTQRLLRETSQQFEARCDELRRLNTSDIADQQCEHARRRQELERNVRWLAEERDRFNDFTQQCSASSSQQHLLDSLGSLRADSKGRENELLASPKMIVAALAKYRADALRAVRTAIWQSIDRLQAEIRRCEATTNRAAWQPATLPEAAEEFLIPVWFVRWRSRGQGVWRPFLSVGRINMHEGAPSKDLHFVLDDDISRPVLEYVNEVLDQSCLSAALEGKSLLSREARRQQILRATNQMFAEGLLSRRLFQRIEMSLRRP